MKRLKIVQQIIIVLFFAVLTPSIVIGFIISNVSQHSVRHELEYSAKLLAEFVGENVNSYLQDTNERLSQIAKALSYLNEGNKKKYLKEITDNNNDFRNLEIISKNKVIANNVFEADTSTLKIYAPINSDEVLSATVDLKDLNKVLGERIKKENRQIYLLDSDNTLIASNTENNNDLAKIKEKLPSWKNSFHAELFGDIKNQPMAYYKIKSPNWLVVVNTTEKITKNTINMARFKIILAISVAGLVIIGIVLLYTIYLYINMRQLFKGINAISKGSYDRKIYLIKNIFTPYEIVYLAKEFNFMAKKIAQSYQELSEKNIELQRLDGFRTNLVSATSHEFRTPLTNIVGYTSRLLRQDIQIDDEMRIKSLKIIKEQAQRLSRMVEDLLVIPDIESFRLQLNLDYEDLGELIEAAVFQSNFKEKEIIVNIEPDINPVYVDHDRIMQVLVNLCDNAIKYNKDDDPILINAKKINGKNVVTFFNSHEKIENSNINKLFEKFVRLDSELTRTTRGTGLGLFIVKGLSNAMGIDVNLKSDDLGFTVTLTFNKKEQDEEENDND